MGLFKTIDGQCSSCPFRMFYTVKNNLICLFPGIETKQKHFRVTMTSASVMK